MTWGLSKRCSYHGVGYSVLTCPHGLLHANYQKKTIFPKNKWCSLGHDRNPLLHQLLWWCSLLFGCFLVMLLFIPCHSSSILGVNLPPLNIMVILTQLTLQLIMTAIFRDNLSLNVTSSLSAMKWWLRPPTLGKSSGFASDQRASLLS